MYDKLAAKVNNLGTSASVLKIKCKKNKGELENKVPDVSSFVKKKKTR